MFVPAEKRPALISVMQGTPAAFSFKSTLKTPVAFLSSARRAFVQTSTTFDEKTVLASRATEDTMLGALAGMKYDRRSLVFTKMSCPSFQRL